MFQQHPARALLDARRHEQRQAPCREVLPVADTAARAQGARAHVGARTDPHRQQGIDARLRQPHPIGVGHSHRRTQPGTQNRLLALRPRPHRPGLIGAGDHARRGAAGTEDLYPAAQPIERLHARVVHDGAVAAERPDAQRIERGGRGSPACWRIDQQQRLPVAAQARRYQQGRQSQVALARQRRDAQQVEAGDALQRKQPGAAAGGADDVVVGERRAVIPVGIGERVADRDATGSAGGAIRALRGNRTRHAHQARSEQQVGDEAAGSGHHRHAPIDLLVFHQLRAGGAHALHHQIEAVALGAAQAVIVHRGAQVLARAGIHGHQLELAPARRQAEGRRARAVGDAHDQCLATTILEELLDRVGEGRGLPQAAEVPLELTEARGAQRLVDRPLEGAADESGDSGGHALNRVFGAALLYEFYAGRGAIGHSSASWDLPVRL